MNYKFKLIFIILISFPVISLAKLKVMTATQNLKSVVIEIGGNKVDVKSFCKGTQDPHFLEAKPSYMLDASKAKLLVSVGLGLEVGWLPLVVRGARNPEIRKGGTGRLVIGDFIPNLEEVAVRVSRAQGDVHPEGNPHYMLDPLNSIIAAKKVMERLSALDPNNTEFYKKNYKTFSDKMNAKVKIWSTKVKKGLKVISYHKTLTYFFKRFGIDNRAQLEPKPGVPPTAKHILKVIQMVKGEGVKLALVENYFDPTVAHRVAKGEPSLKVKVVPVSVQGNKDVNNLFELYEALNKSVTEVGS